MPNEFLTNKKIFDSLDKNIVARIFELATNKRADYVKSKAEYYQASRYENDNLVEFIQVKKDLSIQRLLNYEDITVLNMDKIREIFSELKRGK